MEVRKVDAVVPHGRHGGGFLRIARGMRQEAWALSRLDVNASDQCAC